MIMNIDNKTILLKDGRTLAMPSMAIWQGEMDKNVPLNQGQ